MATAKRDLTDLTVQGHTLDMEEARHILGASERGVTAFLREHKITYLKIGREVAISQPEFDAALEIVRGAGDPSIRAAAREIVARGRAEQGLPPKIKDPTVIGRVVALLQPIIED